MEEVYENRDRCVMQEKFHLDRLSDNVLKGKYPLEPYEETLEAVFGGELVTQTVLAAWRTIDDVAFSPHSVHSYFVKAASSKTPLRFEVDTNSQGKTFINKSVKVFQDDGNELIYVMNCSFVRNNNSLNKKLRYTKGETTRVPFEFSKTPNEIFQQYINENIDNLDSLVIIQNNNELLHLAVPLLFMDVDKEKIESNAVGDRELGFFVKIADQLPNDPREALKMKFCGLCYISDGFFLGSILRALGVPLTPETFQFFRVSLDQSIYIHDNDFDSTQWLFCDYRFHRMVNERVLCVVTYFDRDGKLIATVIQEALLSLPKTLVDQANGGSYKL